MNPAEPQPGRRRPVRGALDQRGYWLLPTVLAVRAPVELAATAAGDRCMLRHSWCRDLATELCVLLFERGALDATAIAAQCTLFDKDPQHNWLVPLHQDLAVPLQERREVCDWTGWSQKDGIDFAQPPRPLLEQLLAARLHLDDTDSDNGALVVVPRSHRDGRLTAAAAMAQRARVGEVVCTAHPGDVLLLRPLLLHRSSKAVALRPRRVLHFLFGPALLPGGLEWRRWRD